MYQFKDSEMTFLTPPEIILYSDTRKKNRQVSFLTSKNAFSTTF